MVVLKKNNSGFFFGVGVVLLLVLLLLVGYLRKEYEDFEWREDNQAGVLYTNENQFCLVLLGKEGTKVVAIEKETQVPLVRGYGSYKAGVVDKLAEQESLGSRLFTESIEHWLGVVIIERYEEINAACEKPNRFRLVWKVGWSGLKEGKNIFVQFEVLARLLGSSSELVEILNPENVVSKTLGMSVVDLGLADREIVEKRVSLAVINKTNYEGLASQASRTLKAMGYDVVINQWQPGESETRILIDSDLKKDDEIVFPLLKVFGFESEFVEGLKQSKRADVVVELGENYAKYVRGEQSWSDGSY